MYNNIEELQELCNVDFYIKEKSDDMVLAVYQDEYFSKNDNLFYLSFKNSITFDHGSDLIKDLLDSSKFKDMLKKGKSIIGFEVLNESFLKEKIGLYEFEEIIDSYTKKISKEFFSKVRDVLFKLKTDFTVKSYLKEIFRMLNDVIENHDLYNNNFDIIINSFIRSYKLSIYELYQEYRYYFNPYLNDLYENYLKELSGDKRKVRYVPNGVFPKKEVFFKDNKVGLFYKYLEAIKDKGFINDFNDWNNSKASLVRFYVYCDEKNIINKRFTYNINPDKLKYTEPTERKKGIRFFENFFNIDIGEMYKKKNIDKTGNSEFEFLKNVK